MADERLRIDLSGGGPWGFRLQGGDGQPITISKVRKRSKADAVDIREGDIVVSANGIPCHGRTTTQVMDSIDEAGQSVTMELIRSSKERFQNNVNHQTTVESRTAGNSTIVTRTDTLHETRPDGSRTTSTTVTREHSYSMPQVQNATPKPFVASSTAGGSSLVNESDGSVTLTIDTKEANIPIFKVKNIAAMSDTSDSWRPGSQDPYEDETLPPQAASFQMEGMHNLHDEEIGLAVPKVMPATPGLPAVDIQKLLEPAESPPDTPTRHMRRKIYADSAFFDDPDAKYPTIQEQVKLAHNVAKILMSEAAVQKSKGSRMFLKRKERAEKYVHEGKEEEPKKGFNIAPAAVTRKPPPEAFYKSLKKDEQIGVWNPMSAAPPPNAPPPPPLLAPAGGFEKGSVDDQICEHTVVAPEKCFNLAAALHASKGKGGQIFAKRRAKSESWVIDEDNVKSPPPPITPKAVLRTKNPHPAVRYEKSPWEAAMETGDVDNAFSADKNKRHTVGADVFKKLPDMSNIPRAWSPETAKNKQHNFRAEAKDKANFKDFNARARGWGGLQSQSSVEDDRRSVSSVASSEGDSEWRAPTKMAAGNKPGYDPRQMAVKRHELAQALGARGFVSVGSSASSDL